MQVAWPKDQRLACADALVAWLDARGPEPLALNSDDVGAFFAAHEAFGEATRAAGLARTGVSSRA